jgi:hypothetical protein
MRHGSKLRTTLALALAGTALAAVGSPGAQASTVCNEEGVGLHDGTNVAYDKDPSPPVRFTDHLSFLSQGKATGLDRAADRSPALSQCGPEQPGGDGGGDGGGTPS